MIADLKPYPAYKDSGVEWLGQVPEGWEVPKLKRVVRNIVELTSGRTKDELYIALENVESWTGRIRVPDWHIEFDSQVKRFIPEDILFGKLRPYLAKVARPMDHGVCVGEFLVLRLFDNNINTHFLEILLRSERIIDIVNASTFGARMPRADWSFIGNIEAPIPPLAEQAAIVRYLNHVDRKVKRFVRAKRKLIALLEEQKRAIIHQAVTRGLDPNVPMKDSGIEWLGEVPEGWRFERGKCFFREVDVRSTTGAEELLSVSHITGITPRSQKQVTMFKSESYVGSKICIPGQIAVNTMWAWMAAIGVSSHLGIVSPSYHVYERRNPTDFSDKYLDLLLRLDIYKTLYTVNSSGVTTSRLRLYPDDFFRIRFLCPPFDEQVEICDHIERSTSQINTTIARTQREISLIEEYRTRLISDVVTGKLDVREAAAALPEEVEGEEPEEIETDEGGEVEEETDQLLEEDV